MKYKLVTEVIGRVIVTSPMRQITRHRDGEFDPTQLKDKLADTDSPMRDEVRVEVERYIVRLGAAER